MPGGSERSHDRAVVHGAERGEDVLAPGECRLVDQIRSYPALDGFAPPFCGDGGIEKAKLSKRVVPVGGEPGEGDERVRKVVLGNREEQLVLDDRQRLSLSRPARRAEQPSEG